jgi:dTDP-4-dehydrorhamnose reductase
MIKVLVIGKTGQLGKSLYKLVGPKLTLNELVFNFIGRDELDLSCDNDINDFLVDCEYHAIINCAAYTAVDNCETDFDAANQINNLAVGRIAMLAKRAGAKLIHISTDYVFDGLATKPYCERDVCKPINKYGVTKLAGERMIQEIMPSDALIIRTSWLYSEFNSNFVLKILSLANTRPKLSVVSDQWGSPTLSSDLAQAVLKILQHILASNSPVKTEIYHFANGGSCSWFEFAEKIVSFLRLPCRVVPVTSQNFPTLATRPSYSVMDVTKIQDSFAVNISRWEDALEEHLTLHASFESKEV